LKRGTGEEGGRISSKKARDDLPGPRKTNGCREVKGEGSASNVRRSSFSKGEGDLSSTGRAADDDLFKTPRRTGRRKAITIFHTRKETSGTKSPCNSYSGTGKEKTRQKKRKKATAKKSTTKIGQGTSRSSWEERKSRISLRKRGKRLSKVKEGRRKGGSLSLLRKKPRQRTRDDRVVYDDKKEGEAGTDGGGRKGGITSAEALDLYPLSEGGKTSVCERACIRIPSRKGIVERGGYRIVKGEEKGGRFQTKHSLPGLFSRKKRAFRKGRRNASSLRRTEGKVPHLPGRKMLKRQLPVL